MSVRMSTYLEPYKHFQIQLSDWSEIFDPFFIFVYFLLKNICIPSFTILHLSTIKMAALNRPR